MTLHLNRVLLVVIFWPTLAKSDCYILYLAVDANSYKTVKLVDMKT